MEFRIHFWYMGDGDITQEQALSWAEDKMKLRANVDGLELIERYVLTQHGARWPAEHEIDSSSYVICVFIYKADPRFDMMH